MKQYYRYLLIAGLLLISLESRATTMTWERTIGDGRITDGMTLQHAAGTISWEDDVLMEVLLDIDGFLTIGRPVYRGLCHTWHHPDTISLSDLFRDPGIRVEPADADDPRAVVCMLGGKASKLGLSLVSEEGVRSPGAFGCIGPQLDFLAAAPSPREQLFGAGWVEKGLLDLRVLRWYSDYDKPSGLLQLAFTPTVGTVSFLLAERLVSPGFSTEEDSLWSGRVFRAEYEGAFLGITAGWEERVSHPDPAAFRSGYERKYVTGITAEAGVLSLEKRWCYRFEAENILECVEKLEDSTRAAIALGPFELKTKTVFRYGMGSWSGEHELSLSYRQGPLTVRMEAGMEEGDAQFGLLLYLKRSDLSLKYEMTHEGQAVRISCEV